MCETNSRGKASVLVAAGLCLLAGCRNDVPPRLPAPLPDHRGTSDRIEFDQSEIESLLGSKNPNLGILVFRWENKPVVMVWRDGRFNGEAFKIHTPTMRSRTSFSYPGLALNKTKDCYFFVELQDATGGQLSAALDLERLDRRKDDHAAGPRYNTANGSCFLISGIRDGLRVKQMKVDMAKLDVTKKGMLSFAAAEPEIKSFFAPPKGK